MVSRSRRCLLWRSVYRPSHATGLDGLGFKILTEIAAIVKTVGAASIADTLFALFELLEESEVAGDCVVEEKEADALA